MVVLSLSGGGLRGFVGVCLCWCSQGSERGVFADWQIGETGVKEVPGAAWYVHGQVRRVI